MAAQSLQLLAPAKLNLFLHITGRRADGYHQLQTLFQLLDFGDRMEVSSTESGVLSLHLSSGSHVAATAPLDANLVIQAAQLLRKQAGNPALGASISLHKQIPSGAGLGGGSADAAICLQALNRLWELNLDDESLCRLGLQLGADVPLFIRGKSAWAEGIGELLSPVELGDCWYLVVNPNCSVSSAEVFCHEHLTRNSQAIKMADFLAGRVRNDCESVTRMLHPEVDQAFKFLSRLADFTMTGTGSSLFARVETEAAARELLSKLPGSLAGFVARGIDSLTQNYS